jgi:hypothetical protein
MTLDEALASTEPLVAAWEGPSSRHDRRLIVFSVGAKPTQLAVIAVPEAGRDAVLADLQKRGVRVGTWVPQSDRFWCVDDQGFTLWSLSHLEADGKNGELRVASGRRVSAAQVRSVTSFVEDEMVHRGVRLELTDGSSVVVADEEDSAAIGDPGYNRDNLSIDAAWADYLGAALAKWMGKPHVNQVP